MKVTTHSPEETQQFAADWARKIEPGAVLALYGDLGAGKTCWVQGLAEGLGVEQAVISPTYTLVNEYKGSVPLYHIDLYRLKDPDEVWDMGWDDYIFGQGITAIEWAERVESILPKSTIRIRIEPGLEPEERMIAIEEGEGA